MQFKYEIEVATSDLLQHAGRQKREVLRTEKPKRAAFFCFPTEQTERKNTQIEENPAKTKTLRYVIFLSITNYLWEVPFCD